MERYGHQVVVGNELNRRKYEVVFVERLSDGNFKESWIRLDPQQDTSVNSVIGKVGEKEIEEDIVRNLEERHEQWIKSAQS